MRRATPWAALLVALLLGPAVRAADLAGEVTLGVEGASLGDLGPTVVFLEPLAGGKAGAPARRRLEIHQKNAEFDPGFLVVAAGETVHMPNDDTIFHNVFSFSRPNDFDLGVYPAGEERSVRFREPGLVRIYCSIHESMSAVVLVVPTRWFAVAGAGGEYRIPDVPPGRYRLTAWNERLPASTREVAVKGSGELRQDLALAATAP